MAGGPLLPSSIYLGGASGSLFPNVNIPTANTNGAGAFESVGVVASLAADAAAVLQFNMPPSALPTGTLKLRILALASASAGVAKLTIMDGHTSPGSNIGAATLSTETQVSKTWTTADVIVETKVTLTASPAAADIVTVLATFNTSGWTLAAVSTWQFSLIWE
jgi:hypothetical protein